MTLLLGGFILRPPARSILMPTSSSPRTTRARKPQPPSERDNPEISARIRVLIVSQLAIIRSALCHLLASTNEFEVIGEADVSLHTEEILRALQPHVVLVEAFDVRVPGLAMLVGMIRTIGDTRTVILTNEGTAKTVRMMFKAGATGYILKESNDAELLQALRYASRGLKFLDSHLIDAVAMESVTEDASDHFHKLSQREMQVLRLLVQGQTAAQIARHLNVSTKTIETYRGRIYEKCELSNRSDLMRYAAKLGLISFGEQISA